VLQGDLFEADWTDASVLYLCATCFDTDQLGHIAKKARRMRPGARIILVDKPLPAVGGDERITLMMRCQCLVTWGYASAYVYEVR
jgi:hypothetical protein